MRLVLPMLIPQSPCIHAGDNQGRNGDIDGEFSPEICTQTLVSRSYDTPHPTKLCFAAPLRVLKGC